MRKMIIFGLMIATAIPSMASAQAAADVRRDRQEYQKERRDVDRAIDRGASPNRVAKEIREARDAQRDYRDTVRDREQDRRDWQRDRDHDRRDWQRERNQDRRDWQRDQRRDWGRDDWRDYRRDNRHVYSRGNWRAPWKYQRFNNGGHIGRPYYSERYWISDPWRYRLPQTRGYQRWVRHYDDVLLVDTRRGRVVDVIRNFFW